MRHVLYALYLLAFAPTSWARASLTLLMQFDETNSRRSLDAMKAELRRLMDIDIDWRLQSQFKEGDSFPDLVIVRFRGMCQMRTVEPYEIDERGALGFSYVSDGQVLRFSEVECNKIRAAIRGAMTPADFARGDELMGRAIGRVLAHELHHMLANTTAHTRQGLNGKALTPRQLISDGFR